VPRVHSLSFPPVASKSDQVGRSSRRFEPKIPNWPEFVAPERISVDDFGHLRPWVGDWYEPAGRTARLCKPVYSPHLAFISHQVYISSSKHSLDSRPGGSISRSRSPDLPAQLTTLWAGMMALTSVALPFPEQRSHLLAPRPQRSTIYRP
jgi:hypothetical protein